MKKPAPAPLAARAAKPLRHPVKVASADSPSPARGWGVLKKR